MAKKTAAKKKAAPKGAGKRDATLTNLRALEKRIEDRFNKLTNRVSALEEDAGITPEDDDQ